MSKKLFKHLLKESEAETSINSYAQLVKLLAGTELEDTENLLAELEKFSFIEADETLYNKLPMAVYYKQLPIVVNGDVLVKVVLLQQADGLILVVPEHVTQVYKDLLEDATLLTEKNTNISLYAEVYNFDVNDEHLQDLIKTTYISAGNNLKPFELKDALAQEEKEDKPKQDEAPGNQDVPDFFGEIEDDLPAMEDISVNEESYKRFKKQSNVIEKFLDKLYEKSNQILKENVRTKFFNKVLIIEVDNKSVYNYYEKMPIAAKKLLSNFGEAIRTNKNTQLVDSFSFNGKRYFVVAENIANNYWYIKDEELDTLTEDLVYIAPTAKTIIKLAKSSVRKESRQLVPYKKGKNVIFVGSVI